MFVGNLFTNMDKVADINQTKLTQKVQNILQFYDPNGQFKVTVHHARRVHPAHLLQNQSLHLYCNFLGRYEIPKFPDFEHVEYPDDDDLPDVYRAKKTGILKVEMKETRKGDPKPFKYLSWYIEE